MIRNKIFLGQGALSWDGSERRSDRYGSVTLWDVDSKEKSLDNTVVKINIKGLKELNGKKGNLIAIIQGTRESTHIGDFSRGLFPQKPNKGEEFILGNGFLFFNISNYVSIGLKPEDGRSQDWLDPAKLYKCHEQTVKLYFEY